MKKGLPKHGSPFCYENKFHSKNTFILIPIKKREINFEDFFCKARREESEYRSCICYENKMTMS